MLSYKETKKKYLYKIDLSEGNIILCTDTKEIFLDSDTKTRIDITDRIIFLNNQDHMDLVISPIKDKIYIVISTKKVYRYYNSKWYNIDDVNSILCTVFDLNNPSETTLIKEGKRIAPITLSDAVFDENGTVLSEQINDALILKIQKSKTEYLQPLKLGQTTFAIPYPYNGYDLRKDHMIIIYNNEVLDSNEQYYITDTGLLQLTNQAPVTQTNIPLIFVFYYNILIDINNTVLLSRENLRERIIDSNRLDLNSVERKHLSNNFTVSADCVEENNNRKFVTEEMYNYLTNGPRFIPSATAPTTAKIDDFWVDTVNFVFKMKTSNGWKTMGAGYLD